MMNDSAELTKYKTQVERGTRVDLRSLVVSEGLRGDIDAAWLVDGVVIQDTELLSDVQNVLDVRVKAAAYIVAGMCLQRVADMVQGKASIDRRMGATPGDIAQVITALKAFGITPEATRKRREKKDANVLPLGRKELRDQTGKPD